MFTLPDSGDEPECSVEGAELRVLLVGDVVGAPATDWLVREAPRLRRAHRADLVVVNAENCAPNGLGMTVRQVERLLDSGVDVITGGNHSWDSDDSVAALDNPRVIRPFNVVDGVPGRGFLHLDVAGEVVTVLNVADECALRKVTAVDGRALSVYEAWLSADRRGTVLVDFHGDHVIEKQIFAFAVDGEAAAVLGTHTHEPTIPLHILPNGTALVTDVGMTGPLGGIQGFAPRNLVGNLKERGHPFAGPMPEPIEGPISLGAVLLDIVDGRTKHIERLTARPEG